MADPDEREEWLTEVRQDGDQLEYAPEWLRADREVVLAAVGVEGDALQHASAALRADRELVLAALAQNGWALEHADASLKKDSSFPVASAIDVWVRDPPAVSSLPARGAGLELRPRPLHSPCSSCSSLLAWFS